MAIRSLFIKPEYGGPAPVPRSGVSGWDNLPTWSNRKNPGSLELDVKAASLLQSFSDLRMKRFMVWMNENSIKCRNNYDSYTWFKNTTNNWDAPKGDIANAKIEIMRRICKLGITGPQKMEDWILIFLLEEGDLVFPKTLGDIISPHPPDDNFRESWMQGKFSKPSLPSSSEKNYDRDPLGFISNPQVFRTATPFPEETRAEPMPNNQTASQAATAAGRIFKEVAEAATVTLPNIVYRGGAGIITNSTNRVARLYPGIAQNVHSIQNLFASSQITTRQVFEPLDDSIAVARYILNSFRDQSMRQAILTRLSPGENMNPVRLQGYTSLPRNLENLLFSFVKWSENGSWPTRVTTEFVLRSLVRPEELNSALDNTTINPRTWIVFLGGPSWRLATWYYNTFFIGFNNVARSITDPFVTSVGVTPGGRISRAVGAAVGTPLMVGLVAFSDQFAPVSPFYSNAASSAIIAGSALLGRNRIASAFVFRQLILATSISTMLSAIIYADLEESVTTAYGSAFILGNIIVPLSPIIFFTPGLNQVWFDISNWARPSQEAVNRALASVIDAQNLQANPLYQGFQLVAPQSRAANSLIARAYSQFFGTDPQNVNASLGIVWKIGNTVFQSGTAVISTVATTMAPDLNTVGRVIGLPPQEETETGLVPVVSNSVGFVSNTMGPILADTVAAAWGLVNTAGFLSYLARTQTANTIWQQYDSSRNNMVSELIKLNENSIIGLRYNPEGSVSSLKIDTTEIMNITNMEAVIDKVKEAVTVFKANIPMNELIYFDFYTDPDRPVYLGPVTGQSWITATREQVLKGVLPLGYSALKGNGLFDIVVQPMEIFKSERTWRNYYLGRTSGQILLQALKEINPDFSEETEVFRFQPSTILLRRFDEIRKEYIRNDRTV